MSWTTEQILLLAPDPASASAGRSLASARHWVSGGATDRAIWGECLGSGAKPYQVQIDLSELAFRCTCPSRKFPCKHAIALFLIWANDKSALSQTEQPDWVNEWLTKRDSKSDASDKPKQKAAATEITDPAAQEKRAVEREAKVAAGLDELDIWLCDLIRGGLAAAQSQPAKLWLNMAARMVDAQAPGLARLIRDMSITTASGAGWEGRLLEQIAMLRLLLEGYKRLASQSDDMQATIRSHIGWTAKQDLLLLQPGIRAEWLVIGKRIEEEDKLMVQRTWLLARHGSALLLHFAPRGQTPEVTYAVGSHIDAEVVYFPGALKQRAVVKTAHGEISTVPTTQLCPAFEAIMHIFASALAQDPWVEQIAIAISEVTPVRNGDTLLMRDVAGSTLPVHRGFQAIWSVLALSGGNPVTLFAEWDGCVLSPMSIATKDGFVSY